MVLSMLDDLDYAQNKEVAEQIRRAAKGLCLRAPFFGLLLLGRAIRVKEDPRVRGICTDGRRIFYNPDFMGGRTRADRVFLMLHETMHIFDNQVPRCGDRDPENWNRAADMRVNYDSAKILSAAGPWPLPEDALECPSWATELAVEQIYEMLKQDPDDCGGPSMGDLVPLEEGEAGEAGDAQFHRQLVEDVTKAAYAVEKATGKRFDEVYGKAAWERLQELKRCEVPWEKLLLGRLVTALGSDALSWVPPNRRWFPTYLLPSRHGHQETELLLGVDVSGSITNEDFARFRSCVVPAARRAKRTTIVTFDAVIREQITTTKPEKILRELKFTTGDHGYTDVRGVFEQAELRKPSAIAVITDGHLRYPDKAYPQTNWVLKPGGATPPWGRVHRLRYAG